SQAGVLTDRVGTLTNEFFVNLLDMDTKWNVSQQEHIYEGRDRSTGAPRWTATAADIVFGSSSELRALPAVYGADAARENVVRDFVAAWSKAMDLGRFELR